MATKYIKTFIGRFQPFHNGHLKVLRAAIDTADLVVVVIGSANQPRTPKNPWSWVERKKLIEFSLKPAELAKVAIVHQDDLPGSDKQWVQAVKTSVRAEAKKRFGYAKYHITLVGCHKDSSTYYLKLYRGWHLDLIPASEAMNATDVRANFFDMKWFHDERPTFAKNVPPATAAFLWAFRRFRLDEFVKLAKAHHAASAPSKITR
jgi:bifunctional NMN adenylyltransferase/nudix hydrolase